ncbi:MAG TPA: hypothetical protein VMC81_03065 [Rhodocyclaceae bacterium]|nr:hypothetical protein [Rhodocyclaceae bacterium]
MSCAVVNNELRLLANDGPVVIGSLAGAANPVAVIDDPVLDHLSALCQRAKAEALANPLEAKNDAVLELCAELARILDLYGSVRARFYGGPGPRRQFAAAHGQLEKALAQLKEFGLDG